MPEPAVPAEDPRFVQDASDRWQVSLATLLPLVLTGLVVLTVLPVIAIGYLSATDTAGRLLSQRAELILDGLENQIQAKLDPVSAQLGYARQAVAAGTIDPHELDRFRDFTRGMLAATPQVFGVGLIGPDLTMRRWERAGFVEIIEPAERLPFAADAFAAARAGRTAYWAEPFFSFALGDTILNYRVSLERRGELLGVLSVGVRSEDLAGFAATASRAFGGTAFVLAGRDRVITYPGHQAPTNAENSTELRPVASVSDPVIARIWDDPNPLSQMAEMSRSEGHWSSVDGVPWGYFYRELDGYAPEPFTIGVALPSADTRRDRWASTVTAGTGLVLMLGAAWFAWRVGRRLSRPTAVVDEALAAIGELDFGRVTMPGLARSRVREWRTMARQLEATAGALEAFRTYLPQALVRRLFEADAAGVTAQSREITVMFLDLEGFTAFSRERSAADAAAYLNAVFARVGPIIEAWGGVIDKYTGDGLLAFWGAPDVQPDHADRAITAAAEILETAPARHGPTPRLRIGMHAGPAIVGNVGFPGRIDYTLVGDTVNIAERIQSALRGIEPGADVVIAASEEVFTHLTSGELRLEKSEPLNHTSLPAFRCRLVCRF